MTRSKACACAPRILALEAEVRTWQERYHELALARAQGTAQTIAEPAAWVDPAPKPPLDPEIWAAVEATTEPHTTIRTAALRFVADLQAGGESAQEIVERLRAGESIEV